MGTEAQREAATGLSINVRGATGRGPTTLAAFDDALAAVGVSNFNLVRLSSIIPPGSGVTAAMPVVRTTETSRANALVPSVVDLRASGHGSASKAQWGHRLYAVWAFEGAQLLGQEAWAGIAWAQDPADGRGLFVEHEGGSEAQVREELGASLSSICSARGMAGLAHQSVVVGARCDGEPVGALVIAPFQAESWNPERFTTGI